MRFASAGWQIDRYCSQTRESNQSIQCSNLPTHPDSVATPAPRGHTSSSCGWLWTVRRLRGQGGGFLSQVKEVVLCRETGGMLTPPNDATKQWFLLVTPSSPVSWQRLEKSRSLQIPQNSWYLKGVSNLLSVTGGMLIPPYYVKIQCSSVYVWRISVQHCLRESDTLLLVKNGMT